jgi:hypothetical protein
MRIPGRRLCRNSPRRKSSAPGFVIMGGARRGRGPPEIGEVDHPLKRYVLVRGRFGSEKGVTPQKSVGPSRISLSWMRQRGSGPHTGRVSRMPPAILATTGPPSRKRLSSPAGKEHWSFFQCWIGHHHTHPPRSEITASLVRAMRAHRMQCARC